MPRWVRIEDAIVTGPGRGCCVTVEGCAVALFEIEGTLRAIEGTCPHRGGPLGEGQLVGSAVACPWHGWEFDVTTGRNVHAADITVRTWPVERRADGVWIGLD